MLKESVLYKRNRCVVTILALTDVILVVLLDLNPDLDLDFKSTSKIGFDLDFKSIFRWDLDLDFKSDFFGFFNALAVTDASPRAIPVN